MKQTIILGVLLLMSSLSQAGRLVSNFAWTAAPGSQEGQLRLVAQNGVSTLELSVGSVGVQIDAIVPTRFDASYALAHDRAFSDYTAEFRLTPWAIDATGALWLPYFGKDNGSFLEPRGLVSFAEGAFTQHELVSDTLVLPDSLAQDPLLRAVGAISANADSWWLAQGVGGLLRWDSRSGEGERWLLDVQAGRLVRADSLDSIRVGTHEPIFSLAAQGTDLWLASARGLWKRRADGVVAGTGIPALDTGRITGIWSGGSPLRIFVESSRRAGSATMGQLWSSSDSGRSFSPVFSAWDSLDLAVSSIAFMGSETWIAVQRTESVFSGLLRVGPKGLKAWSDTLPSGAVSGSSRWVWGLDAGVIDRDAYITGVCSFPLAGGRIGLAVTTYGGGVSVSADSGKTWKMVLNQVAVGSDLAEIRMVPSVLRGSGATALVAYQLSQASEITIEIFSYDMKKVRTLVRGAKRTADPVRSSDPRVDVWDGKDDAGRPAAMGTYYVKVRDNRGHVGWGKVMSLGGAP